MRTLLPSLILLSLAAFAPPARADDTTPPQLSHTPVTSASPGPVTISVGVTSERKVYPQLFTRPKGGAWKTPLDLKKGKSGKWETTLTLGDQPIEYYVECYDEVGNGPARVGDADKPIVLSAGKAESAAPAVRVTEARPTPAPAPSAPPPPPPAHNEPAPAPPPRHSAPAAAVHATAPSGNFEVTQTQALWHSALAPGWGQWGSDRKIRAASFGGLAAVGVISSILLAVRANDANNIYESCQVVCKQAAYDQAVSYQVARNWAIGLTAAVWAINVAEAYFLYGTHDP